MTICPIVLDTDPLVGSPLPLIDLDLIKAHLAVDFDDQNDLIEAYWLGAIEAFEGTTHRTLAQRQHRWVLKDFERDHNQSMWLPRGRIVSVDQIDYVYNGTTTTLTGPTSTPAGTDYQEALFDGSAIVLPLRGETWPNVDCDVPEPVKITFTAGWTAAELPKDVLNALLFYTRTSLDDNRTDPQKTEANLRAFETMCSSYRLTRFY